MCYNCVRTRRGKEWLKWGKLRFSLTSPGSYLYLVVGNLFISWIIPRDRWIKPEVFKTKLRMGMFLGPLTGEWWWTR